MLHREREQEILNTLKIANGFVSVKQLCKDLFASESSVRRDLKVLEKKGLIKRSYGGATLLSNYSNVITFNNRTRQNMSAKCAIAQKAASLIKDGSIVFLDQSSTAFYLANEIANRNGLVVVTNNVEIMMLLSNSSTKLISSGGFLSEENRVCLIGSDAQATFENIHADFAFFSVRAVSDSGIVADCTREEVTVRNTMLRNAGKKVLLCDSTKFGAFAPFKQCMLSELDYLISEGDSAQKYAVFADSVQLL